MQVSISAPPVTTTHRSVMTTSKMKPTSTRVLRKRQKHAASTPPSESSPDSDMSDLKKLLATADKDIFNDYIELYKRPLTKHDKEISALNDRAVDAFHKNDRKLFAKIISKTTSLYVHDCAVILAAEVDWIEVVEQLLTRETSEIYEYPVWTDSLSIVFLQLNDSCTIKGSEGRWLLKMAVLSSVKKHNEAIFNLLAPVAGVDFTDICGWDVVEHVVSSQLDLDAKKKWLRSIIKYIDQSTSCPLLESAIYHCAKIQLGEPLPYLLDCLFSTNKDPSSSVITALSIAIENHHWQIARCIIDGFRKAGIPINRIPMYDAVDTESIEMVKHLYQSGCNSFPLQLYGERPARDLHTLLLKNNLGELYPLIILK